MTDTTITPTTALATTGTEFPVMEFPAPRPAMVGLLARAEAAEQAALARVAELEAQLAAERTTQITDGADARLVDFWEKAGRIADHADFCNEYDRLAEAMNGTPRERDWYVSLEVQLTVRVSRTVSSTTEDGAIDYFRDDLDKEAIIDALRDEGWEDFEVTDSSAERD